MAVVLRSAWCLPFQNRIILNGSTWSSKGIDGNRNQANKVENKVAVAHHEGYRG